MTKYNEVLVVDDQIEQVELMTEYLSLQDIHTKGVTNFAEFKSAYQQNKPDLIVLDISMPDHDAYDYINWLAFTQDCPPLLFMSGIGSIVIEAAVVMAQKHKIPVLGQLNKPFSYSELTPFLN